MIAIWKREVQSYFFSPLAYIFIGAFMIIAGVMFSSGNVIARNVSFNATLNSLTFIFMLLVPILTMKLISEDKRNKTDQLLLTAPLTVPAIIMGKYLAAVTVFAVTLIVSFVFPVILSIYGMPAYGEIVAGYIGFFLLGCALIAVGVFISSITESQVISALVTFFVLMIMWMGNIAVYLIPSQLVITIIEWLSVYTRLNLFAIGIISLTPIIYFLSYVVIFLFLAIRSMEKRRWSEG
ncbi:MAG: ABC-2 transporter permease [Clostridiales bacterium]|nr:ABC-2 transporter permease [Clostridiales bacterium]